MAGRTARKAALTALFLLVAAGPSLAASRTVTESASYLMSDSDSRSDARRKCSDKAKRIALDQAGSVFQATLTAHRADGMAGPGARDDLDVETRSTFAAVISADLLNETLETGPGGVTLGCTVRITYDPDEVARKMQDLADAESLRGQLASQQQTIDALKNQVGNPAARPPAEIEPPVVLDFQPPAQPYVPPAQAAPPAYAPPMPAPAYVPPVYPAPVYPSPGPPPQYVAAPPPSMAAPAFTQTALPALVYAAPPVYRPAYVRPPPVVVTYAGWRPAVGMRRWRGGWQARGWGRRAYMQR